MPTALPDARKCQRPLHANDPGQPAPARVAQHVVFSRDIVPRPSVYVDSKSQGYPPPSASISASHLPEPFFEHRRTAGIGHEEQFRPPRAEVSCGSTAAVGQGPGERRLLCVGTSRPIDSMLRKGATNGKTPDSTSPNVKTPPGTQPSGVSRHCHSSPRKRPGCYNAFTLQTRRSGG